MKPRQRTLGAMHVTVGAWLVHFAWDKGGTSAWAHEFGGLIALGQISCGCLGVLSIVVGLLMLALHNAGTRTACVWTSLAYAAIGMGIAIAFSPVLFLEPLAFIAVGVIGLWLLEPWKPFSPFTEPSSR